MLSKKNKLARKDFPIQGEKKEIWNGTYIRVVSSTPTQSTNKKFAVVVGKKFYTTNVKRNHFKRQALAIIHKHIDVFNKSAYGKFVLYPLSKIDNIGHPEISLDIDKFLRQHVR